MLSNYFKISWRNIAKHPFYSLINILGLGIGFVAVFFILLYIQDELSYDRYQTKLDNLYRINFFGKLGDQDAFSSASPGPGAPLFEKSFPEVQASCRIRTTDAHSVRLGDKTYREQSIGYVDSSFFELFTADFIEGTSEAILNGPGQVVINTSMAKKYFGDQPALGKTLIFGGERPYRIGAVIKDFPGNGHFEFDFLLPLMDDRDGNIENWGSTNYHTYFLLRSGTDVEALSHKMNDLFVENFKIVLKQYLNSTWDEFIKQGNFARIELFPVHKIHLYSHLDDELKPNGSISQVYIFGIVGVMILLLACINFINLSTARAAIRAKEVGIRKSVGAIKGELAVQFLGESMTISTLAWVFSIVAMILLLPSFNALAGKTILFSRLLDPTLIVPILIITILTGLLAGTYPAFYLAAFEPIKVLKGTFATGAKKSNLRNGLVVFQFFISLVLIIGSLAIYNQMKYIQNKKLGFNKSQVLIISDANLLGNNMESFKSEILKFPQVKNITAGSYLPVSEQSNSSSIIIGKVPTAANSILVNNWWNDYNFIRTMEMEIIQGRDFSKDIISDSSAVVINETLAKHFGYPGQNIEGKILGMPEDDGRVDEYHIIGVLKDFNFLSLHHPIEPLAIFQGNWKPYMSIRLETDQVQSVVDHIRSLWNNMSPGNPFTYNFMDERYDKLYKTETRIGKISFVFAFLAVFIACIGLLGLATFTIQQRFKEIGIRKVLGASAMGILGLMFKDFVLLIGISIGLASPLAWYLMSKWLQGFAYRMDLSIWLFIIAGVGTLSLALLMVGIQSMKAAMMNPVKAISNGE